MKIPKPNSLSCKKCGVARIVPSYWRDMSNAAKLRALSRLCKRCGTGRKKSHGLGCARIYMTWYNMMIRCGHIDADVSENVRKNYLSKGIKVCPEWHSLEAFSKWAAVNGYKEGFFIDRKENDKGYNPENCRWVTARFSGQNRTNLKLSHELACEIRERYSKGEKLIVLANCYAVSVSTLKKVVQMKSWT